MLSRIAGWRCTPVLLPLLVVCGSASTVLWKPTSLVYHILAFLLEIRLVLFILCKQTARKLDSSIETGSSLLPHFTLIISCKDESGIICNTLETLCFEIKYPNDCYRIIVLDDHSTDDSFERAVEWTSRAKLPRPQCLIFKRRKHDTGGGKSGAMNAALREILIELHEDAVCSGGRKLILGFLDADAYSAPELLAVVADCFTKSRVAALQVCKRPILIGALSLLEYCQAADYMADMFLSAQRHLRRAGCACLRGNGMFFDAALLLHPSLAADLRRGMFFNENTTGDDVDMTCRLKIAGLKIHYLDEVVVYEELAPSWRALLIQRARWVYGGYRRYIDFFGSIPRLWWQDPDEMIEFVVLLAPLFFLTQLVLILWFKKGFTELYHCLILVLWDLGLMYRACTDTRMALLGFLFSFHRSLLVLWAIVICIWSPSKPLEYRKTTRRFELEDGATTTCVSCASRPMIRRYEFDQKGASILSVVR
ncbi:hypothetical protein F1559_003086 [Cyanidiococcus yangmingshanensis]|uniref:Uncharacterized protein n=1 Tax=Cyanidiococcus yangmingshanensis TaxID=2690220 RepID=A0A7J7IRR1_9RHOD|nr:hypothetical protein F1559_003086 [Cyanidiococcus yangmingshanensis]